MRKVLSVFVLLFAACTNNETLNIQTLEDNGYKEIKCNNVISYTQNNESVIEVNSKLSETKSFLLARCFNKHACLMYVNVDTDSILCQRYIIDLNSQDKRDYLHSSYKEFDDHSVYYKLISKEDLENIF